MSLCRDSRPGMTKLLSNSTDMTDPPPVKGNTLLLGTHLSPNQKVSVILSLNKQEAYSDTQL